MKKLTTILFIMLGILEFIIGLGIFLCILIGIFTVISFFLGGINVK